MAGDTKQQQKTRAKVSLVFLPLPGMGHLVPMVELAKAILLRHDRDPDHHFSVTMLNIPPAEEPSPQISSFISSVVAEHPDEDIVFRELPKLDPSLVADRSNPGSFLSTLMEFQKPHVASAIQDVNLHSSSVAAVIVNFFCVDMIDVADDLGVPCYVFFTGNATSLGFALYMPTLDAVLPAGKDMLELQNEGTNIDLPGFSSPVPPMAAPQPFLHRKEQRDLWFMPFARRFAEAKGIIVNSYLELEPHVFKALEDGDYLPNHSRLPVYPVGPLISLDLVTTTNVDGEREECLRWLDGQPLGSVVFLCFGSMGSFSKEQAAQVAVGLEQSGHRFLWVLRGPPPEHLKSLLRPTTNAVLDEVLPQGFLERTRDRGMVRPNFAPQAAILGHKAVGAFVTHCGWNSILESLWFGVPMLAWPLQAEQHLNAFGMAAEMGVAKELKIDRKAGNWATADEIERGVRCLMETDSMEKSGDVRSKVTEMSEKGRGALLEGGSSFRALQDLTALLSSNVHAQPEAL